MPKTIPNPITTNGRMISKNAESICLVVSVRFNSIGHQRILHLRLVSIIKYALFKHSVAVRIKNYFLFPKKHFLKAKICVTNLTKHNLSRNIFQTR